MSLAQDELQRSTDAVDSCRAACAQARARRVVLLKANRDLNHRRQDAAEDLLHLARARPSPATRSGTAGNSGTSKTSPQPERVDAPLSTAAIVPRAAKYDLGDSQEDSGTQAFTYRDGSVKEHGGHLTNSVGVAWGEVSSASKTASLPTEQSMLDHIHEATAVPAAPHAQEITKQLRAARHSAAEAAGVPAACVRWVLQGPHAAPNGAAISFSSEIASPQCMASLYAVFFTSLLEEPMLAAALGVWTPGSGAREMNGHGVPHPAPSRPLPLHRV